MRIERLSPANFKDYETLTSCGDDGKVCYCSFWHLKVSMEHYDSIKRDDPLQLREVTRSRMASGFHVGALAYEGDALAGWLSVGPLPEFYWAWRRVAALGERAGTTAGILCCTIAPAFRGQGAQRRIGVALADYGRAQGWTAIEAYPFADASARKQPAQLSWPGFEAPYREAGFVLAGPHWLSHPPDHERLIYIKGLST